jgi:uncharacterized protein
MKPVLGRLALIAAIAFSITACASQATSGSAAKVETGCEAGKAIAASDAGLDQVQLCIQSGAKSHSFTVEMARTGQQQQQGLMFRTALADDKGMLFPFAEKRMASFWMKNTLIPLDIIFIAGDGKIVNIAENTTPYSVDPVQSTAPVMAVLELRGGLTAQMRIKAGDKVSWK